MTCSKDEESKMKRYLKSQLRIRPPVDSDPRLLSRGWKALILVIISLAATTAGFSSTIYFPGMPMITEDFHAPPMATTLTAALFILFMGISPVIWAALSDYYQIRRFLLFLSMIIFAIASLGNALMTNIWGMVVLRCVQSVGASCGQAVGAGVIADTYEIERRGAAFGKFFLGFFIGPLVGPILGGFLIMSDQTWRATFWFCFVFGILVAIAILAVYPETYRIDAKFDAPEEQKTTATTPDARGDNNDASSESTTLSIPIPAGTSGETTNTTYQQNEKNDVEKQQDPPVQVTPVKKKHINPIRPFFMLRHPHVMLTSLVASVAFGSMFAVETVLPDLFESNYNFVAWQTGLSFLGAGVGNTCGAIINGFLSDRLLMRARAKRGGKPLAEDRLTANLWSCGFVFMPFGLLLFGWGIERRLSYWTGIVGFGVHNFGMNQIMTATSAYLVDAVPGEGASITAAANLVRMVVACVLTLVVNPLVSAIGPGYTMVILAVLAFASMALLAIVKFYGPRIRRHYGLMQPSEL